jgi:hypothetical protein
MRERLGRSRALAGLTHGNKEPPALDRALWCFQTANKSLFEDVRPNVASESDRTHITNVSTSFTAILQRNKETANEDRWSGAQ